MTNQSDNSFKDEDKDDREQQVSRFKENTLRIRSLMQKSINDVSPSAKPKKQLVENKVYMIHLSEVSTDGKSCMEYSKTLNQFDFLSLIEEFFGVDIEQIVDLENVEPLNEKTVYFETFEEVIDFLKQRNKDEE